MKSVICLLFYLVLRDSKGLPQSYCIINRKYFSATVNDVGTVTAIGIDMMLHVRCLMMVMKYSNAGLVQEPQMSVEKAAYYLCDEQAD